VYYTFFVLSSRKKKFFEKKVERIKRKEMKGNFKKISLSGKMVLLDFSKTAAAGQSGNSKTRCCIKARPPQFWEFSFHSSLVLFLS